MLVKMSCVTGFDSLCGITVDRLMETNEQQVEGHSMIAVKYSKDVNSNQDSK